MSHPDAVAVEVLARARWNRTGVDVEEGATYQLTADGVWCDRRIRCGPDGYGSPTWLFRSVERWRRHPAAAWFALVGSVDGARRTRFVIGRGIAWTAPVAGELHCFANDLPGMRFNNSGQVRLTVTRSDPAPSSPAGH